MGIELRAPQSGPAKVVEGNEDFLGLPPYAVDDNKRSGRVYRCADAGTPRIWREGPDMKIIHHVVDIDARTPTVWAALTERDRMAGWWSTKVTTPPAAVGAEVRWTFTGDFNPVMEIVEVREEQRLEWRCVGGHDPWQDNRFRFELVALDDGRTRLRFWQDYAVELDDDSYGIYNFNWGYYLESLRLLCADGQGKPFQVPA